MVVLDLGGLSSPRAFTLSPTPPPSRGRGCRSFVEMPRKAKYTAITFPLPLRERDRGRGGALMKCRAKMNTPPSPFLSPGGRETEGEGRFVKMPRKDACHRDRLPSPPTGEGPRERGLFVEMPRKAKYTAITFPLPLRERDRGRGVASQT